MEDSKSINSKQSSDQTDKKKKGGELKREKKLRKALKEALIKEQEKTK